MRWKFTKSAKRTPIEIQLSCAAELILIFMKSFYHNTRPFYHNTRPFYHNTLLKAIILSPIPTNTDQYSSKSKDILAFRLVKISRFHHRHFGIAYKVLTQIYFCFGSLFSICRNHTVCLKDLQSNISRFHYRKSTPWIAEYLLKIKI